MAIHPKNPKYIPKPYVQMQRPGQRIQTDNGSEFTNRFTTPRDKPTLFQAHLAQHGIQHKVIRPFTPRHNGEA